MEPGDAVPHRLALGAEFVGAAQPRQQHIPFLGDEGQQEAPASIPLPGGAGAGEFLGWEDVLLEIHAAVAIDLGIKRQRGGGTGLHVAGRIEGTLRDRDSPFAAPSAEMLPVPVQRPSGG